MRAASVGLDVLMSQRTVPGRIPARAPLSNEQKESLHMITHKVGRILNGDPNFIDSWRDLAGYATLIVNSLSKTDGATDNKVVKLKVKGDKLIEL